MSEVAEKVKNIVIDHLGVDADKVTLEASFIEDLGADSFDLLELVTALEDEFGLTFDDEILQKIKTIGDAVDAIVDAQ